MLTPRISHAVLSCLALFVMAAPPAGAADEEIIVIEEGSSVSIEYTLTLDDGRTADTNVGGDPLTYTQGAGQILPRTAGSAISLFTTLKASRVFPAARSRFIRGMSIWAGQVI